MIRYNSTVQDSTTTAKLTVVGICASLYSPLLLLLLSLIIFFLPNIGYGSESAQSKVPQRLTITDEMLSDRYISIPLVHRSNLFKEKTTSQPVNFIEVTTTIQFDQLASQLEPTDQFDVRGGQFWFKGAILNQSSEDHLSIHPYPFILDDVQIWIKSSNSTELLTYTFGYNHPRPYSLHYGGDIKLPFGYSEYLIRVNSRYFTAFPNVDLKTQEGFKHLVTWENALTLMCIGGLFVLGLYNFYLFVGSRKVTYLFYSAYLTVTAIEWSAVFNLLYELFGMLDINWVFWPIYLIIIINTPFYVSLLRLQDDNRKLMWAGYSVAAITFLCLLLTTFIPYWVNNLAINLLATCWLTVGLASGIIRYRQGYKPARFFILGFTFLVIGGIPSLTQLYFPIRIIENTYLFTLVCQTIDGILLAMALADKIKLLEQEKNDTEKQALAQRFLSQMELEKANNTLKEALEVKEQEKLKQDNFIMALGHELKTPLNSIVSAIDSLEKNPDLCVQPEQMNYLKYGSSRLMTQVMNMVALAEIETDSLQVQSQRFDVQQVFDKLIEISESSLVGKDVTFCHKISDQLPGKLVGDPHLIYHLLTPVLENACIYTDSGKVTLSADLHHDHLDISVKDTGKGMSSDTIDNIFDSFYQVDHGLKRQHQGLGLGLTVASRIARAINAEIEVKSNLDKGSCVNIHIPVKLCYQSDSQTLKIENVLIVEDNLVNAKILNAIVNKLGYQTEIAENGLDGLEKFKAQNFDLVLMDLQMPVMDGIEATREIKKINPDTPIVAVTANTDSNARSQSLEAGMDDILEKPVKLPIIKALFQRYTGISA